MKDIAWEKTYWDDGEGNRVTIQDVLLMLEGEAAVLTSVDELISIRSQNVVDQLERIKINASNLSYPIIIVEETDGFQYILDGYHRLQKAIEENRSHVLCRVLRGGLWK